MILGRCLLLWCGPHPVWFARPLGRRENHSSQNYISTVLAGLPLSFPPVSFLRVNILFLSLSLLLQSQKDKDDDDCFYYHSWRNND